ncbi:MAG: hypothetical protein HYS13_15920 [Planctomycetia bacterium]|nr:hypothetical protein [Planctomycetia bacterium]
MLRVMGLLAVVAMALAGPSAEAASVGGPKGAGTWVGGYSSITYTVEFWGGELAEAYVAGEGAGQLDLYVYDRHGNLVAFDDTPGDLCGCRWVPTWTDSYRIMVVNRSAYADYFVIVTN